MNWDYISGFFDADGSITLCRHKSTQYKSPQVTFHNTDKGIIESIQAFLKSEGINSHISIKKAIKENHSISYDLKCAYNHAIKTCEYLQSIHAKKQYRIACINKFYKLVTPRNGKYSKHTEFRKQAFERLFFLVKN